jgi:hypothetical protein
MLLRRIILGALMQAARNPAVQKKAGEAAGKALEVAKPGLMRASRRAGELARKAKDKLQDPET